VTALDAGFATAMDIKPKFIRDIFSILFSGYYLLFASEADEKVGQSSCRFGLAGRGLTDFGAFRFAASQVPRDVHSRDASGNVGEDGKPLRALVHQEAQAKNSHQAQAAPRSPQELVLHVSGRRSVDRSQPSRV